MTAHGATAHDDRVLLLAPTRKDAETTAWLLRDAGIAVTTCPTIDRLVDEFAIGLAVAIVPDEVMTPTHIDTLAVLLQKQPPWSDVPILVLAGTGAASAAAIDTVRWLDNVTILERPLRIPTFLSAIRSALRARRRQYEIREHLAELASAERTLRDREERLRALNEQLEERVRERTSEVRSLFERLVSAQEEERRRIARDIHDQVGQQITALRMNLETLRAQTAGQSGLVQQTTRTQQLAEELDQSIDFLTWQLRPAALDHLGLSAALQSLATGWSERFGVNAEVVVDGVEDVRLPRDVEANLYRIAQEALHNVAKHARATRVSVFLTQNNGDLVLLIEDDGRGFTPVTGAPMNGAMGLISMRERAALVGGRLEIESATGEGTSVYVRIPN